jgi:hypothetical protein
MRESGSAKFHIWRRSSAGSWPNKINFGFGVVAVADEDSGVEAAGAGILESLMRNVGMDRAIYGKLALALGRRLRNIFGGVNLTFSEGC